MAAITRNTTSHLPFGTHYQLLHPIPVIASRRFAVYNHEGIRRCYRCLCLQKRPQSHQSLCPGSLQRIAYVFPCLAGCGRTFSTPISSRKHAQLCQGFSIARDRYGTHICPRCGVAGFSGSAVTKHLGSCTGRRSDILNSYASVKPVTHCGSCGKGFLRNGLGHHTCGIVGDPVWLGQQAEPPDLSISYIRWCRQNDLTLGGIPGKMPDAIVDRTISVRDTMSKDERVSSEEDDDSDGYSDVDDRDDEYAFSDDDYDYDYDYDYNDKDVETEHEDSETWLGKQDANTLESHKARMEATLRRAGITFDDICNMSCEGLVWRHGYFPCPFHMDLTPDTVYFRRSIKQNGVKQLQVLPFCYRCASLRTRISRWVAEGKYTVDGVHLCRRGRCRRPVAALWHCRYHADQLARINVRREKYRGCAKAVPPEYLVDLIENSAPKRLVCPRWRAVKNAVTGKQVPGLPVFFVDTESVYDQLRHSFVVCELAVRSAFGDLLLQTSIDHGLTYEELRQRVRPNMYAKIARIYDFQSVSGRTHGATPEQVSLKLSSLGMSPSALLVEWSTYGFDLNALRSTFSPSIFPPSVLLGHTLWRELGVPGSMALLPFFSSVFPYSDLNQKHHFAAIDSKKLFLVVRAALSCFTS
ncbi:hypothetical protein K445DRAFT_236817 [Daldinia sp. EC12]|nr:hypothetical protein K445DRAFT_236817 [Daldinia sp. EC12]